MKICVIGLGYIGLPTSAMFAKAGQDVIGVDLNEDIVRALNKGEILIEEDGLAELVKEMVDQGRLRASLSPKEADAFIIAVPTPMTKEKKANMDYVIQATESILPYLKAGDMVVLESTSPAKTVENIIVPILKKSGLEIGLDLFVAHSPERVIPGKILYELTHNSRIIGGVNEASSNKIKELYEIFVKAPIYTTSASTAEMCKLMENTYRAVNIALANELAIICENIGMNAWDIIDFANHHPRVNILQPGPGVGGHCIAVDPWFVVDRAPDYANIIKNSLITNEDMPFQVFKKIKKILGKLSNKKITILGVSFKPNVDDVRESPIGKLIDLLGEIKDLDLVSYDPHVKDYPYLEKDIDKAFMNSNLMVLAVHHDEFKNLDYGKYLSKMNTPIILDLRGFLRQVEDDSRLKAIDGFEYHLFGASSS